jgi:hypothetical protein
MSFSSFEYHIFYILYPLVTYLLTVPRKICRCKDRPEQTSIPPSPCRCLTKRYSNCIGSISIKPYINATLAQSDRAGGETDFWLNAVLKGGLELWHSKWSEDLGSISALQNFPEGISEGKDNFWH